MFGHSFALDGAGYAGGLWNSLLPSCEGLRGRKADAECRSCGPADGATRAHAFAAVLASRLVLAEPQIARFPMFAAEVV